MLSKDEEIIGFCPLIKVPRKGYEEIRFIGEDEASYMDFVIKRPYKNEAIERILDYLIGLNGRFIIIIHGIFETSDSCKIVERSLKNKRCNYLKTSLDNYYISIDSQNFDDYFNKRFEHNSIRRKRNKQARLNKLGEVSF